MRWLVFLLLAGCGCGSTTSVTTDLGMSWGAGRQEGCEILVRPYMNESAKFLIAHEIGHRLGLSHTSEYGCIMNPNINRTSWHDFHVCTPPPSDLLLLDPSPELRSRTIEAAELWNAHGANVMVR